MYKNKAFYEDLTPIQGFYAGKTIFITGGTGFVGKLVVEKLLRCCRHVKKIYLLIREKKERSADDRLDELLNSEVFENVSIFNEDYKKQVFLIEGDIEKPNLGLSDSDRNRLIDEVNLVFHIAAAVRFDLPFKKMVYSNIVSTREVIKLAHEIKDLTMFTHVSTAYSFSHLKEVKEKLYDVPMTPAEIIKLVDETPEEELEKQTEAIIGKWQNTYVFTKAIAEYAVQKEGVGLPRVIARPTIITSTYKEPLIGWADNFFGPMGVTCLVALGVIHVLLVDKKALVDYIPADFVVNHILAVTHDQYVHWNGKVKSIEETAKQMSDVPIYICSSTLQNPVTFGNQIYWLDKVGRIIGSTQQYCHAWTITTSNFLLFNILHTIFHVIPGYIMDFGMRCMNKKPRFVKGLNILKNTSKQVVKFTMNTMLFHDDNTRNMMSNMAPIDKEIFYCDISKLCWHTYAFNIIKGGRKYLLKESTDSIKDFDDGVANTERQAILHYVIVAFFLYLLYLLFGSWFKF